MMDITNITKHEYLFALCITDGLFEEMNEIQKATLLSAIRDKDGDERISTTERTKKRMI